MPGPVKVEVVTLGVNLEIYAVFVPVDKSPLGVLDAAVHCPRLAELFGDVRGAKRFVLELWLIAAARLFWCIR